MNTPRITSLFAISLLALTLTACSGQRALHMVEASGDRAMERSQYQLAADEYAEIVDRRPSRWDAHVKLARALLKLNRPLEAREHLEVAYAQRPNNEEVVDLLATAMLESGDIASLTRELRDRAENSGAVSDWVRLGIFLLRAGDLDASETALLTAAQLDRGRTIQPQMGLARLYGRAGDENKALNRLRMALYIEPDNPEIQQAIRSYGRIPGPTFAIPPIELSGV